MNAWPVDMLQPRDVYVSDHFLKQVGPSIGDNVANAIYARSGNGIVYDGAVRDINDFNGPTRIGHAMVMLGDVVLGPNGGVIFIPPQLAERVVTYSERTHLEDMFGHQRQREKKYTAGQIDAKWTPEIEQDFHQWLKENEDYLPAPKSTIEAILNEK